MSAITRDPGDLFSPPPGLFPTLVANKALSQFDAWVAPGWRLGGPCVAQGSPNPNPSRQRVAALPLAECPIAEC
jgi:hypothetical protein